MNGEEKKIVVAAIKSYSHKIFVDFYTFIKDESFESGHRNLHFDRPASSSEYSRL